MLKSRTMAQMLLILAVTSTPSIASPILIFDGYALKEACADGSLYYTYGKCAGYIIGAHDEHVLAVGSDVNICVSLEDGRTPEGLIAPVVAYLDRNPERLFEPASTLVISALKEAFVCR